MILTKTGIEGNKTRILSEYQCLRLVRKEEKATYYVARCLTNSADATVVDQICYVKQTVTSESKERHLELFNNEVRINRQIKILINDRKKYFTEFYDSWYETSHLEDKFTIVSRWEQYGDLQTFLEYSKAQDTQLTEKHLVYILNNILKALTQLHRKNIIHRNIKPQNIFIDQFFQFKIGDFSLALQAPNQESAKSSEFVGTYGFMSPELFSPPYSFEVDVWAVGVIHYFLIYRVYPYSMLKEKYQQKINWRLKGIENENKNSDKFSERMKRFMKRFFRPRNERETAQTIYEFEFLHSFRITEIVVELRQLYDTFICLLNDQFVNYTEKYILQQHCTYHQKILEVVHYPKWGYFFFLTNLKTLAYFNDKTSRTYPDSFEPGNQPLTSTIQQRQKEEAYRKILEFVDSSHFVHMRKYIREHKKTFIKKMDAGIDTLIQCKNTLLIKLKSESESLRRREIRQQNKGRIMILDDRYKMMQTLSINENKLNYDNHTIQLFFFQKEQINQSKHIAYITYKSSIILNNSMLKTLKKRDPAVITVALPLPKKEEVSMKKDKREKGNKRQPSQVSKQSSSNASQISSFQQEQSIDKSSQKGGPGRSKSTKPRTNNKTLRSKKGAPSEKMEQIIEQNIEPQIVQGEDRMKSQVNQQSAKNQDIGNNPNRKRMNINHRRTKSQNQYGEYVVKKTGRPNVRVPFKKMKFQKIDAKKEDYYWLVDKERQPEITSFVDYTFQQQILVGEVVDGQQNKYRVKKYANQQALYSSEEETHKNMLKYTKQLLSMMLNRKRQAKRQEPFLKDYIINQY